MTRENLLGKLSLNLFSSCYPDVVFRIGKIPQWFSILKSEEARGNCEVLSSINDDNKSLWAVNILSRDLLVRSTSSSSDIQHHVCYDTIMSNCPKFPNRKLLHNQARPSPSSIQTVISLIYTFPSPRMRSIDILCRRRWRRKKINGKPN